MGCADVLGFSLTDWWPIRAPLSGVGVLALAWLALSLRRRIGSGAGHTARVAAILTAAILLSANAAASVNAYYGYYLTVGQALGQPGQDADPLSALNSHTQPTHGVVVAIHIPDRHSHFAARPAEVYVPPAWFAKKRPRLPVLVLLHGTPGAPTDWLDGGQAPDILDAWAGRHHGLAPIVVMPDINSTFDGDTECVDSTAGNAETYLTVDLPDYVHSRFFTLPAGRNWAIAGLSEGGSCAIMLALRHPGLFATFADYSGLAGPRSGDTNALGDTVAALFHGSTTDFQAHEPALILAHHRFPQLAGWFEVGAQDTDPLQACNTLLLQARAAGIHDQIVVIPGASHTFAVWSAALHDSLPWLIARTST